MAIYRRSSRRPFVVTAVVAALAGLIIGVAAGRGTAPDLAAQVSEARAQVAPIVTSLEVLRTEYPKLLNAAAGGDPGGAESALARARSTFASHAASWSLLDPATTTALDKALNDLAALLTGRAPEAEVGSAVDTALAAANKLAATQQPA
jgi:hypothetical protein